VCELELYYIIVVVMKVNQNAVQLQCHFK